MKRKAKSADPPSAFCEVCMKRAVKRHPGRDEPRADSVEADELPPR